MLKQLFANDDGSVKPWVVYAVLAIAVVGGGMVVYARWKSSDQPLTSTVMCASPGCGYLDQRVQEVGEAWPQKCPKCGQEALFVAFSCRKCGAPNIWNENRGLPPPTKCIKCGQENRHGS